MTQKLFCLCAACALLFAISTVNVASAEETSSTGCPCAAPAPCKIASPCDCNPCVPPVAYRVGPFGVVRPVAYAPAFYPAYYPYRYVRAPFVPYRAVPAFVW